MFNKLINFIKNEVRYQKLKKMKPHEYRFYTEKEYFVKTGEVLNLDNPRKYTEKIQYAKLYINSSLKTLLTDKYEVRKWVSEKVGSEYLIPLLGVWNKYSEIDFNKLPNKFVLKTNHAAGGNLIVQDKSHINHLKENIRFTRWIKKNFAFVSGLQLHYKDIQPKIIAEEYIEDSTGNLPEYKFFCFNGTVHYCWHIIGRFGEEYRNFYDLDWKIQPWIIEGHKNSPYDIPKPPNYDEMIKVASKLSEGFSHVRVDLYNVDGKIFFGEMTFTNTSGYRLVTPEKYNYLLGELWELDD